MKTSGRIQALDEIIIKMRSGRIKRRTFVESAIAIGLSSSVASSVLAACGGSSDSSGGRGPALNLVWQNGHETTDVLQRLVNTFNQENAHGLHITYLDGPTDSGQLHRNFLDMMSVRSSSTDILSMDIIWPAEFAVNQWVVPLNDRWPAKEREKYLEGPVLGCTFGGQVWAAPMATDAGLIYYRKDLMSTPPQTWEELATMARDLQVTGKVKYGYVWQGALAEGLTCDFSEVLYSYGGAVLDPGNPRSVIINSPEAVQALTTMVSWVDTISPPNVTLQNEEGSRIVWENGDAAFMRNWPYAYALSNSSASKVAGKFAVRPMLSGGMNIQGHSVTGGWQLGINAFSSPDKIDAAWQFIQFIIGEESQKKMALEASLASTLKSIYQDKEVLEKNPFFKDLGFVLQTALSRPVSPRYPDITNAIQIRVHQALTKQSTPGAAIAALQEDLQFIVTL